MKNNILIITFFFGFLSFGQVYWEQKDSIKGPPRSAIACFVIGNRGYAVGGLIDNEGSKKMYSYSKSQNDWDDEIALGGNTGGGQERYLACGFSIHDKGYITLGQGLGSAFMNDLWEYDKVTDSWTQKADFPGGPRRGATSFVIDGIAYVGTGENAQGLCQDFYAYDPQMDEWTPIADFPGGARRQAVGFELQGYGWLATGDAGTLQKDLWSYNVVTDVWQQKADLPGVPRLGAVAWSNSPSAYIATGESATGVFLDDVWQYNYYQNAWNQTASMWGGRSNACSFVIGGTAYVGGGYNGQFLDDFYAYQGLNEQGELHIDPIVYPNPTQENVTIQGVPMDAQIHVYHISGTKVNAEFDRKSSQLKLANLETGNYIISIMNNQNQVIRCIQKQ